MDNSRTFFNGKNIPCIPPIIHEAKFVTDFQVKSKSKTMFFFQKWKSNSPSALPPTKTCLSNVIFSENDILKLIRKLVPSKAHGHDEIRILMLK